MSSNGMSRCAQLLHAQQLSLRHLGSTFTARSQPPPAPAPAPAQAPKGRWTELENAAFIAGLKRYGRNWPKVQQVVKTRNLTQIRTHAQKFFKKIERERTIAARAGNQEAVARLTRTLESKPQDSAVLTEDQYRVRPRTDPITGAHLRLASEDVHTPSHNDKRVRSNPRAFQSQRGPEEDHSQHEALDGIWTESEEIYAEYLIKTFYAGRLALHHRCGLLQFLVAQLNIPPLQIEHKFGARCELQKEYAHRGGAQSGKEAAAMQVAFLRYNERRSIERGGVVRASDTKETKPGSRGGLHSETNGDGDTFSGMATHIGMEVKRENEKEAKQDFISETRIGDDSDEEGEASEQFKLDAGEEGGNKGNAEGRSNHRSEIGTSFSNLSVSSNSNSNSPPRQSSSGSLRSSFNSNNSNNSLIRAAFGSNDSMLMRDAFGSNDSYQSCNSANFGLDLDDDDA
jgi:SHAQKYF class myb-like DNA-binding protein